jgi:FKBP-type peptidyl-prolyl cis-trans isomerase
MKFTMMIAALSLLSLSAAYAADAPAAAPTTQPVGLDTLAKRAGYAVGLNIGGNLKQTDFELDPETLVQGIHDALTGAQHRLTEAEVRQVMREVQQRAANRQVESDPKLQELAKKNKTEGDEFLAKNKAAEGVKTTASGLQYRVVKEGEGKAPTAGDIVTVHYTGKLISGDVYDSSKDRGPATFPVAGVIPGWTEALQLMKEGGQLQLFIPSNLAYGPAGTPGGPIPPNAVLLFDVELISVKK